MPQTSQDFSSSVSKFYLEFFLGYAFYAGGIWKGTILVADIEELELLDANAETQNAKDILTPKNSQQFTFPITDGTIKLTGGSLVFPKSTSIRDQTERGEEHKDDLRGESDGAQPLDTTAGDSEAPSRS